MESDSQNSSLPTTKSPAEYQQLRSNQQTNGFSDIINSPERREKFYQDRTHDAWLALMNDITRWKDCFKTLGGDQAQIRSDRLVFHHIGQFEIFAPRAFDALLKVSRADLGDNTGAHAATSQLSLATDQEEADDFKALVVGVFTSQWVLLRDVIIQRVTGSPYRAGLITLDEQANTYYAQLYNVVNGKFNAARLDERYRTNPLVSFAPLIYLGNTAQLTVFNRRAPLVISVPFGSLSDMPYSADSLSDMPYYEYTRLSLAHEIAHALFDQVPEMIDEIKSKLTERLIVQANPSRSQRVILEMIIQWTEEICADLFGTALGGIDYVESARRIMAGASARVGITDEQHPPAVLRPMLHLLALKSIAKLSGNEQIYDQMRQRLAQDQIDTQELAGRTKLLGRQFQSVPALMFVRLGTISDILIEVVEKYLLPMELDILNQASVEKLLAAINGSQATTITRPQGEPEFESWVDVNEIKPEEFVIDLPRTASPVFATPGTFTHPFCCDVPLLKDFCC